MNRRSIRLRLPLTAYKAGAVAVLLAAPAGCPGTLNDPERFLDQEGGSASGGGSSGGGTCDAPDMIFAGTCAVAGCHTASSAATAGNLDLTDLTPANVAQRLINVPASGMMSVLRINTADPAQSALITKLSSPPPFGLQMPYGGSMLSANQIQCITSWVDAQAASTTDDGGTASSTSGSSGSSSTSSSSSSSSSGSSTSSSSSSSSSGSSSGLMEAGTIGFAKAVYPIIQSNCTDHHAGNSPSGGLDLSSESTAFQNLTTGSSSAQYEPGCNEHYVVSGNAGSSLLYQKVVGGNSLPSACGAQMPKGGTPLSAGDVAIIQDWIQGGAAP